jgi:hypothetical protein
MSYLSESESQTSKSSKKITTIADTHVEMGINRNGFYHKIAHDEKPKRYDLGNC